MSERSEKEAALTALADAHRPTSMFVDEDGDQVCAGCGEYVGRSVGRGDPRRATFGAHLAYVASRAGLVG